MNYKKHCTVKSITSRNIYDKKLSPVEFSEKEQKILDKKSVVNACEAAAEVWQRHKNDAELLVRKLNAVRKALVSGNSPKSLFSKWLKSVGIPRATAYWKMNQYSGEGKKQPSVTQLIQKREKLEIKLSKVEKDDKSQIKAQIDSVKNQLSRRREVLQNRLDSISADLKEVVNAISAFNGTPESKGFGDLMGSYMKKTDVLFSKMTTAQQTRIPRRQTSTLPSNLACRTVRCRSNKSGVQCQTAESSRFNERGKVQSRLSSLYTRRA